ncbi:hypothetical protein D3C76_54590 [compost metagenome]
MDYPHYLLDALGIYPRLPHKNNPEAKCSRVVRPPNGMLTVLDEVDRTQYNMGQTESKYAGSGKLILASKQ